MIEGKVAQILNMRELVINKGGVDGVTKGMKFSVLEADPIEVTDPDTKESLGIIDREKIKVQATEVNEHFSICSTYETISTPGIRPYIDELFSPSRTTMKTLKDARRHKPLDSEDTPIQIGDRIRQIVES